MFKHRLSPVFAVATLLAPIACERDGAEATTVDVDPDPTLQPGATPEPQGQAATRGSMEPAPAVEPGPTPGEPAPAPAREGMDAEVEQRVQAAQQRYDQLEKQYEATKQKLEAKGDEVATKTMNELEQARMEAKNKLEAARAATAANAREALQEFDSAIEKLDKQLADQPQT